MFMFLYEKNNAYAFRMTDEVLWTLCKTDEL